MKSVSHVQLFATPWTVAHQSTRSLWLLRPLDFPGKSTGVVCHFLLQGIFLTQGSNPGLPHCRQDALPSEPPVKGHVKTDFSFQATLLQLLTSAQQVQAQPQSPGDEGMGLACGPWLADPSADIPRLGPAMQST